MNKKHILFIFVFICIIILIIVFINITSFRQKDQEKLNENQLNFYEVRSYLNKPNNWIYYMNLEYNIDGEIIYYDFDGINMKIDKIDDLYFPVRKDGELYKKLKAPCNCLLYYHKYRNDLDKINKYFTEKKFQSSINLENLKDLDIETDFYSKEDLVYLFNQALKINYKRPLGNFEYVLTSTSKKDEAGEWTIVTDGSYGYLEIINIDYKYNNGKYLSEIAFENNTNSKKYNDIKNIEMHILNTQSAENICEGMENINCSDYKTLFELISEIGTTNEGNEFWKF